MAGAGLTVMAFSHHGEWTYWSMMTAIIAALLALAWTPVGAPSPEEPGTPDIATNASPDHGPERAPVAVAAATR